MLPTALIRAALWKVAALTVASLIVSCGSSEIDGYFDAAGPVFDRHSETMVAAETSMFEVSRLGGGDGLSFGADARTAARLLPIFSVTADAVERDIAAWDEVEFPESAREYHSLIGLVMSLRLQAMIQGEEVLGQISAGQIVEDPFLGPENAMTDANAVLARALDEAVSIRD